MTNPSSETPKSWVDKLSEALLREPQSLNQLLKILRDACSRNLLDSDTLSMVEGVIRYSALKVRDIMLPRLQIISISSDSTFDSILEIVEKHSHSRYPIYDDNIDSIIGILHAKDLLMHKKDPCDFSINDVLRPATFVPESKPLNILLTEFKRTKNHMAIVVDEYGGVSGFVTIEDVIEQIVGDIEDEFDNNDDAYINKHADGRYIVKATIPISEFNEYFKLDLNTEQYETLAGLLIKTNESLPEVGEIIKIANQSFKILNSDNRRIKLVEFTVKDLA
jgi:magnesium and cobalt transporter